MQTQDVSFYSGPQLKLAARLYFPSQAGDRKTSGIVFCHGFGGVKEGTPPGLATLLADHGYPVLTFDYRGFGASEGIKGLLNPAEQVEDACHAVEFMACQSGIERIAIYGTSFGGGVAVAAARRNPKVRCGVISVPVASGRQWLESVMRWYEFQAISKRADHAIRQKALTGEIEMGDRFEIMVPDPYSRSLYQQPFPMALESFLHIVNHKPLSDAPLVQVPMAVIAVDEDPLVPSQQARDLYENLGGPKQLTMFQGDNHYAVYESLLDQVFRTASNWFDTHLQGG